jgi:MiaB-like tRNA modifying enzyme
MKKIYFKTFGCRTNIYDTMLMKNSIKDFKIVEYEEEADIIVVNSCTVTNSADGNVRNYINRQNREGKRVYLGGCGAFSKGEELFKSGKVYGVFGHSLKEELNELLKKEQRFEEYGDLEFVDRGVVVNFEGKSRAFIKIQEGCNFECSYCIIPSVRGKARSIDEALILKQIEILASNGFGEFVLTGTNIGSYGVDRGSTIAKLLKKISNIRGVRRVRLGSLEPSQIDDEFLELLGERWLEKHLHIALQHTSEKMLKLMRRRDSAKKYFSLFKKIADFGFAIGSDFITGHPGESEEIWQEALSRFKEFPLTHLHAFTYSKRENTRSASMGDIVSGDVALERLKILQNIVKENNYNFRVAHKDKELEVLIENKKDDFFEGYDQFYNKVLIKSDENIEKEWVYVKEYEIEQERNVAKI